MNKIPDELLDYHADQYLKSDSRFNQPFNVYLEKQINREKYPHLKFWEDNK